MRLATAVVKWNLTTKPGHNDAGQRSAKVDCAADESQVSDGDRQRRCTLQPGALADQDADGYGGLVLVTDQLGVGL
jgi:hypothetical protein